MLVPADLLTLSANCRAPCLVHADAASATTIHLMAAHTRLRGTGTEAGTLHSLDSALLHASQGALHDAVSHWNRCTALQIVQLCAVHISEPTEAG